MFEAIVEKETQPELEGATLNKTLNLSSEIPTSDIHISTEDLNFISVVNEAMGTNLIDSKISVGGSDFVEDGTDVEERPVRNPLANKLVASFNSSKNISRGKESDRPKSANAVDRLSRPKKCTAPLDSSKSMVRKTVAKIYLCTTLHLNPKHFLTLNNGPFAITSSSLQ